MENNKHEKEQGGSFGDVLQEKFNYLLKRIENLEKEMAELRQQLSQTKTSSL